MILFKVTFYGFYQEGDDPVKMTREMAEYISNRDKWYGLSLDKIDYVIEDSHAWHEPEDPDGHPYNQAGGEEWLNNHPELKEVKYRND